MSAIPPAGPAPGVWAVVVAGGSGARFGGPKQFSLVAGRPVVDWSVEAARSVAEGVVLVVPAGSADGGPESARADGGAREWESARADRSGAAWESARADRVVAGGATRSASVRAGLAAVPDEAEVIVVHDAARPVASAALFEAVVAAVRGGAGLTGGPDGGVLAGGRGGGADGAVPGYPAGDTVKRVGDDGRVVGSVDRSTMVLVQTPQAFRAAALRAAHAGGSEATDDAGLVEAAGGRVVVVPGERANMKLTHPEDLVMIEALLASRCRS